MDLIGFKDINDRADHATGDYVLKSFVKNLRQFNFALSLGDANADLLSVSTNQTVARLGGDEFGLLLPGTSIANAERYIRQFYDYNFKNPVRFALGPFAGQERIIYFRAGIASYNDPNSRELQYSIQKIEDLLHAADHAERVAKEQGGNPIRLAQS
jgi:diguanylate cyclase (GGDEF)-like protein